MPTLNPHISAGEVKVLFTLLDAADEAGLLRHSPVETRWREAKKNLTGAASKTEGQLLWDLLNELEQSQTFKGNWIQDRWRTIKTQVERAKALTNHPFNPRT